MRAILLGLGVLIAIAAIPAPAPGQGHYDRLYRGVSPDPTDNRYDARPSDDARAEAARRARAAERMTMSPYLRAPKMTGTATRTATANVGSRDTRDTKC
jgi:hypothetical protein